jgi:hypothetical protein
MDALTTRIRWHLKDGAWTCALFPGAWVSHRHKAVHFKKKVMGFKTVSDAMDWVERNITPSLT